MVYRSMLRGFELSITSGDISHRIDALVIPSLRPDYAILENGVVPCFGAAPDWKNQSFNFLPVL